MQFGGMYFNGDGVPQNYTEAAKWFLMVAEQGDAVAQGIMGVLYFEGRGVRQDFAESIKWLHRCAEQNIDQSNYYLMFMYGNGLGVPKDYIEAYKWLDIDAAKGFEITQDERNHLAENMAPADISEAQRLAREWLEDHGE